MLLWLVLALLGGGVVAWLAEGLGKSWPRVVALLALTIASLLLLEIWLTGTSLQSGFAPAEHWYAFARVPWIPALGVQILVAMDGLSLLLVALTVFLGFVAVLSAWVEITERPGFFYFNLLWTLAGAVGVFVAFDLFLFFVVWEVMLVPMYLIIAIWGHEQRAYAATKFFLFTQVSSLILLIAILALVFVHAGNQPVTFDYFALLTGHPSGAWGMWLMLGFAAAFLVKLPALPFHTWLPDAHTQAPTAGSVILAGVLLKTGAYGLIRFVVPLFPDPSLALHWPAMLLGAASVLYGGYMAFAQTDFKRVVAYSSVSHMGFVLLGVFAWNRLALQGAVVQMLAHGLATGALFVMAGVLQSRLGTRDLAAMGGLWQRAPRMGGVTLFLAIAALGLPGLGSFVGEFLVLLGGFQTAAWPAAIAAGGFVIAAVYALSLMQRAFLGAAHDLPRGIDAVADLDARELAMTGAMMAGLLWLGLHPQPFLDISTSALTALQQLTGAGA